MTVPSVITLVLLAIITSIAFGIISVVIEALNRSKRGEILDYDNGAVNFLMGFFFWPIFLPIFTIYGTVMLINYTFIKPLIDLANKSAAKSIKPKDDLFLTSAKEELNKLLKDDNGHEL